MPLQFVVASDLPNASYVTWLDAYILAGFFLITLVVIENVVASRFEGEQRQLVDIIGQSREETALQQKTTLETTLSELEKSLMAFMPPPLQASLSSGRSGCSST